MRTKVFLTVDTEFSIGGAFQAPRSVQPIGAQNVMCQVAERSEGLGFMLDTFGAHGLRATFFVEALQIIYFGDAPMGEIVQGIAAAGHDLQLHLHPVWTYFDHPEWPQQLARVQPNDDLHGRSVDQLVTWMQRGIDTFGRWGMPAPVALRTGNLMVDRNVYRAMTQVGLKVASNIARAVFEPAEPQLRLNAGIHRIEGVVELPVLTYADLQLGAQTHRKALTITGSSLAEACCLLDRAHAGGARSIVLLTHCHEFVKGDMRAALVPDRVNQRRLEGLCRYLRDNADRFEVTTMERMATLFQDAQSSMDPLLSVPAPLAVMRLVQNKLNELNLI
jgi:peptidoglycan/xylan/chitin deacetylase (PgdA/CDA1 family)